MKQAPVILLLMSTSSWIGLHCAAATSSRSCDNSCAEGCLQNVMEGVIRGIKLQEADVVALKSHAKDVNDVLTSITRTIGELQTSVDALHKKSDTINAELAKHSGQTETSLEVLSKKVDNNNKDMTNEIVRLHKKLDAQDVSLQKQSNAITKNTPPYGYPNARVFHVQHSAGPHKLTYNEAVKMCESKGAQIATKAQVHTAQRLGYQKCSWGWVKEKVSVYPMQWPTSGCGWKDGVVGPSSRTHSNVYCFK